MKNNTIFTRTPAINTAAARIIESGNKVFGALPVTHSRIGWRTARAHMAALASVAPVGGIDAYTMDMYREATAIGLSGAIHDLVDAADDGIITPKAAVAFLQETTQAGVESMGGEKQVLASVAKCDYEGYRTAIRDLEGIETFDQDSWGTFQVAANHVAGLWINSLAVHRKLSLTTV